MADSNGLAGANPLDSTTTWLGSDCQLSLIATRLPEESYTLRTGSASTPESPKPLSVGPSARSTIHLGWLPVTIKPPIRTLSPPDTSPRVERLSAWGPTVGNFVLSK